MQGKNHKLWPNFWFGEFYTIVLGVSNLPRLILSFTCHRRKMLKQGLDQYMSSCTETEKTQSYSLITTLDWTVSHFCYSVQLMLQRIANDFKVPHVSMDFSIIRKFKRLWRTFVCCMWMPLVRRKMPPHCLRGNLIILIGQCINDLYFITLNS